MNKCAWCGEELNKKDKGNLEVGEEVVHSACVVEFMNSRGLVVKKVVVKKEESD